uniref:DUF3782 domain-containing protein n=1 Tax=Ignisphaera aggregans TaxID=334771 RepID=A0A7J2U670_9CREN
MSTATIDWSRLEEVVERAVRRARAEELKDVADAIKTLAEYVKKGYDILAEHSKRIEEHSRILEEHSKRIEELIKEVRELSRIVNVVAHRFGVLSEEAFRNAMKYVIEEFFGVAKVEKWVYNDAEGFVHGVPAVIEVDVVIRDREYILLEVKSRVSRGDVYELSKVGKLYEKVTGVKPRLAIIGGFMDRGVKEMAERLGVEIILITTSLYNESSL